DTPRCIATVIPGRDACRLLLLDDCFIFGTPTSLLYRSDLLRRRDPFYVEDSRFGGDSEACLEVLDGHMFAFVHQVLAYSRVRAASISAGIRDNNPYHLHKYIVMQKYGRRYLNSVEFRAALNRDRDALYDVMASNMFRGRGKEYWDFQRSWL